MKVHLIVSTYPFVKNLPLKSSLLPSSSPFRLMKSPPQARSRERKGFLLVGANSLLEAIAPACLTKVAAKIEELTGMEGSFTQVL